MHLTAQQRAFFDTFGYLAFPGLLLDRIDEITHAFEAIWENHGGGHDGQPHDPTRRSCIVQFVDQSETLCTMLDDPRIYDVACDLLGDDFNYMGSDGNLYAGDTPWHSDGHHEHYLHVKFAFYLDRIDGADVPALAFSSTPGDVVVFDHNLKHAAFHGSGRRRMFTMNICQRYAEKDLPDLRDYLGGSARFWLERNYDQTIIDTASPKRIRHLEQVMANDYELAELSRKARQKNPEPSRG